MADITKHYTDIMYEKKNFKRIKDSVSMSLEKEPNSEYMNLILLQGAKNPYQLGINPRDVEKMMKDDPAEIIAKALVYKASQAAEQIIRDGGKTKESVNEANAMMTTFNKDIQSYESDPDNFKNVAYGAQSYDNKNGSAFTSLKVGKQIKNFQTDLDFSMAGSFGLGDAMMDSAVDFMDSLSLLRLGTEDHIDALQSNVERQIAQQDLGFAGNMAVVGAGVAGALVEGIAISYVTGGFGSLTKIKSTMKALDAVSDVAKVARYGARVSKWQKFSRGVELGSNLIGTIAGDINDNAGLSKDTSVWQSVAQAGAAMTVFSTVGRGLDTALDKFSITGGVSGKIFKDRAKFYETSVMEKIGNSPQDKIMKKAFKDSFRENKGKSLEEVALAVKSKADINSKVVDDIMGKVELNTFNEMVVDLDKFSRGARKMAISTMASSIAEMAFVKYSGAAVREATGYELYGERFRGLMDLSTDFMDDPNLKSDEKKALLISKMTSIGQFVAQKLMQRTSGNIQHRLAKGDDETAYAGSNEWYKSELKQKDNVFRTLKHFFMGEQVANIDAMLRQTTLAKGGKPIDLRSMVEAKDSDMMKIAGSIVALDKANSWTGAVINKFGWFGKFGKASETFDKQNTIIKSLDSIYKESTTSDYSKFSDTEKKRYVKQKVDRMSGIIKNDDGTFTIADDGGDTKQYEGTYMTNEFLAFANMGSIGTLAKDISKELGDRSSEALTYFYNIKDTPEAVAKSKKAMKNEDKSDYNKARDRGTVINDVIKGEVSENPTVDQNAMNRVMEETFVRDSGKEVFIFKTNVNEAETRKNLKTLIEVFDSKKDKKGTADSIAREAIEIDNPLLFSMAKKIDEMMKGSNGRLKSIEDFKVKDLQEVYEVANKASIEIVNQMLSKLKVLSEKDSNDSLKNIDMEMALKFLNTAEEASNRLLGNEGSMDASRVLKEGINSDPDIKRLINTVLKSFSDIAENNPKNVDEYLEMHMDRKLARILNNTIWNMADQSEEQYNKVVTTGKLLAKALGFTKENGELKEDLTKNQYYLLALTKSLANSAHLTKTLLQTSTFGGDGRKSFSQIVDRIADMEIKDASTITKEGGDLKTVAEATLSQIALKTLLSDFGKMRSLLGKEGDNVDVKVKVGTLNIEFNIKMDGEEIRISSPDGDSSLKKYIDSFTSKNKEYEMISDIKAKMQDMTKADSDDAVKNELNNKEYDTNITHKLKVANEQIDEDLSIEGVKDLIDMNSKGDLKQARDAVVDAAITLARFDTAENKNAEEGVNIATKWLVDAIGQMTARNVLITEDTARFLMRDRSNIYRVSEYKMNMAGKITDIISTTNYEVPRLNNFQITIDMNKDDEELKNSSPDKFEEEINKMFEKTLMFPTGLAYSNAKELIFVKIPSNNKNEIKIWLNDSITDYMKTVFKYGENDSAEQAILKIVQAAIDKVFEKGKDQLNRTQVTKLLAKTTKNVMEKIESSDAIKDKIYSIGIDRLEDTEIVEPASIKSKIEADIDRLLTSTEGIASKVKALEIANNFARGGYSKFFKEDTVDVVYTIDALMNNSVKNSKYKNGKDGEEYVNTDTDYIIRELKNIYGIDESQMGDPISLVEKAVYKYSRISIDESLNKMDDNEILELARGVMKKTYTGTYDAPDYIKGNTILKAGNKKMGENKKNLKAVLNEWRGLGETGQAQFFLRGMNTGFNTFYSKNAGKRTITTMKSTLLDGKSLNKRARGILEELVELQSYVKDENGNSKPSGNIQVILAKDYRDVNDGTFYMPKKLLNLFRALLGNKSGEKLFASIAGLVMKANVDSFPGSKILRVLRKATGSGDDRVSGGVANVEINANSIILDMNTFKEFDAEFLRAIGIDQYKDDGETNSSAIELNLKVSDIQQILDIKAGKPIDVNEIKMDSESAALLQVFMGLGTHTDIKTSHGKNEFSLQPSNTGDSFSDSLLKSTLGSKFYKETTKENVADGEKYSIQEKGMDKWKHKLTKFESWGHSTMLQAWDHRAWTKGSPDESQEAKTKRYETERANGFSRFDMDDKYDDSFVAGSIFVGKELEKWLLDKMNKWNDSSGFDEKDLKKVASRLINDKYDDVKKIRERLIKKDSEYNGKTIDGVLDMRSRKEIAGYFAKADNEFKTKSKAIEDARDALLARKDVDRDKVDKYYSEMLLKLLEEYEATATKPNASYEADIVKAIHAMTSYGKEDVGIFQRIDSNKEIKNFKDLEGIVLTSIAVRYPHKATGQMGPAVLKGIIKGKDGEYVDGDYNKVVRSADFDGDTWNVNISTRDAVIKAMNGYLGRDATTGVEAEDLHTLHNKFLAKAKFSTTVAPSVRPELKDLFKDELFSATGAAISTLDIIPNINYALKTFFEKGLTKHKTLVTAKDLKDWKRGEQEFGREQNLVDGELFKLREGSVVFYDGKANAGNFSMKGSMENVTSSREIDSGKSNARRYHLLKAFEGDNKNGKYLLIEVQKKDTSSPSEEITKAYNVDELNPTELRFLTSDNVNEVSKVVDELAEKNKGSRNEDIEGANVTNIEMINNYMQSGPIDQIGDMGLSVLVAYFKDFEGVKNFIKNIAIGQHLGSSFNDSRDANGNVTETKLSFGIAKKVYNINGVNKEVTKEWSKDFNDAFIMKMKMLISTGQFNGGKIAYSEQELKMFSKFSGNKAPDQMTLINLLSAYKFHKEGYGRNVDADSYEVRYGDQFLPPRAMDGLYKLELIDNSTRQKVSSYTSLFSEELKPNVFSNLTNVESVTVRIDKDGKEIKRDFQYFDNGIKLRQNADLLRLYNDDLVAAGTAYKTSLQMAAAFNRSIKKDELVSDANNILNRENGYYSGSITSKDIDDFKKKNDIVFKPMSLDKEQQSVMNVVPGNSYIDKKTESNGIVMAIKNSNTNEAITTDNLFKLASTLSNNGNKDEKNMAILSAIVMNLKSYQEVAFAIRSSGISNSVVDSMTKNSYNDYKTFADLEFDKEILLDFFKDTSNNELNYKFNINFNKEVEAMKKYGCSFN